MIIWFFCVVRFAINHNHALERPTSSWDEENPSICTSNKNWFFVGVTRRGHSCFHFHFYLLHCTKWTMFSVLRVSDFGHLPFCCGVVLSWVQINGIDDGLWVVEDSGLLRYQSAVDEWSGWRKWSIWVFLSTHLLSPLSVCLFGLFLNNNNRLLTCPRR